MDDAAEAPARATPPAGGSGSVGVGSAAVFARIRARTRARRQAWRALGMIVVVLLGSAIGAALAPSVTTQVGPLEAEVRVRPSVVGGVRVLLPPAGEVSFATHWTPVAVTVNVVTVDLNQARTLLGSPTAVRDLGASAPQDLRAATLKAAAWTAASALIGAGMLSALIYRGRWRRTAWSMVGVLGLLATISGTTALVFDADRFAQPRFAGLLSQAPYVAGEVGSLAQRLESYRAGVADIVQSVTTLYAMSGDLPVVRPSAGGDDVVTVLHVSDLHLNPLGFDLVQRLVRDFGVQVVVDSGDITTWGTSVESATLSWIGELKVPYVFVRGNHDSRRTQALIASYPNAVVLDGAVREVAGLRFAGIGDPVFTPDGARRVPPAVRGSASRSPAVPAPSAPWSPGVAATGNSPDIQVQAGTRLAEVIAAWNQAHPITPVNVAVVHEPYAVPPLRGTVPLVLDGHFHSRNVELDEATGTREMREGSTGGAGISADFQAIREGKPLPLEATLLYVARSGARAGQVLAYDEVTVGGFGLASASVERTVVRPEAPPTDGSTPDTAPSTPAALGAAEPATRSRRGG